MSAAIALERPPRGQPPPGSPGFIRSHRDTRLLRGPKGKVEMVGHQATGAETQGNPLAGIAQELDKGVEVAIYYGRRSGGRCPG